MEYHEDQEDEDQQLELNPNLTYTNDSLLQTSTPRLTPVKIPMESGELVLPRKPKYKECLKNHAVAIGGHATDGCGEFMAAGPDGTLESLKCASCNCHRNFHRKENTDAGGTPYHQHQHPLLLTHHPHGHFGYRSPSGYLHVTAQQRGAGMPLALPSSSGGGGSRDEMDQDYYSNPSSSGGKKRFRTRFTQEQKDKMLSLAERLGWRIQKQDEEIIQQFCNEVGVKRHVLKVWMHNNKHTLGKKS